MRFKIISPLSAGLFVTFLAGAGSSAVVQLIVPQALTAAVPSATKSEASDSPVFQIANGHDCNNNREQQEEGQGDAGNGNEGEGGIGAGGSL